MSSGTSTLCKKLDPEVTNISPHGIWILSNNYEYFISFKEFPFFEHASIKAIANIETDREGNFHWPDLDVDIELASIDNQENYPLIFNN